MKTIECPNCHKPVTEQFCGACGAKVKRYKVKRPEQVKKLDDKKIRGMCKSLLDQIEAGISDDRFSDMRHYLFEELLVIVYGKSVWKFINERR